MLPAPTFLAWNLKNVFKAPARQVPSPALHTAQYAELAE
jgi:hypothetical protein